MASACSHPSGSDPFTGERAFAQTPKAFSNELTVGDLTETDFAYGMSRDEQTEFAADKEAVRSALAEALTKNLAKRHVTVAPAPQPFVIEPTVTWIDPGAAGTSAGDGDLRVTVRIQRPGEPPLDVVDFRAEASGAGRRQRLEHVAAKIGKMINDYLLNRIDRS